MKKIGVVSTLATTILTASFSSFAAPPPNAPAWGYYEQKAEHHSRKGEDDMRGHRYGAEHSIQGDRYDRIDDQYHRQEKSREHLRHRDQDRYERNYRNTDPTIKTPYGHQMQRYQRGQRIDRIYLNDRYYVNDWRARRLATPPSGQRWLNVNGEYLLVAIATGIITNVILNH